MHFTKQVQCTHTPSDWMSTEWHHVSAVFDLHKGKQRMRSDHQLAAPTGADGCVGPEHPGLLRNVKTGCWRKALLPSKDSEADQV